MIHVGALGGLADTCIRSGLVAEVDVFCDRPREQPRVLQHHAHAGTHIAARHRVHVHAVDSDLACIDVIKTHQQVHQRGLARAGRTHNRDLLAGLDLERQVRDQLLVGIVREAHILELDAAQRLGGVDGLRVIGVGDLVIGFQHFEDALCRSRRGLQLDHQAGQFAHRLVELLGVLDESLDRTQSHGSPGHRQAAHQGDQDIDQVRHESRTGHHDARQHLGLERSAVKLFVFLGEGLGKRLLLAVNLDQGMPRERLLDAGVESTHLLPLGVIGLLRAEAHQAENDAHQRQGNQHNQGQLPRDRKHHRQDPDHGQHRGQHPGQGLLEHGGDVIDVVGDARNQVAALDVVKVGQRQAVDLFLDALAQTEHGAHHDDVHGVALGPAEHRRTQVQHHHQQQDLPQRGEVNTGTRHHVHLFHHVSQSILVRGAQTRHHLSRVSPGRDLFRDKAGEHDVGGARHNLGRDDGHSDRGDTQNRHAHQRQLVSRQQAHHLLEGRAEILGFAAARHHAKGHAVPALHRDVEFAVVFFGSGVLVLFVEVLFVEVLTCG